MECVRHLDGLVAIQLIRNKKGIEKLKKQAKKDTIRRIKKQEKLQKQRDKQYEKKIMKENKDKKINNSLRENEYYGTMNGKPGLYNNTHGTVTGHSFSQLTNLSVDYDESFGKESVRSHAFSDSVVTKSKLIGAFRSRLGTMGRKSGNDISLSSPHSGPVYSNHTLARSTPLILLDSHQKTNSNRHRTSSLNSLETGEEFDPSTGHMIRKQDGRGHVFTEMHYDTNKSSRRVTNGSMASRASHHSNDSNDSSLMHDFLSLRSLDFEDFVSDVDLENPESAPLLAFLASLNLEQFTSSFVRESIDLQALSLCTDDDLRDIGVPLGPRRKILDAIEKRKQTLINPGVMCDTRI